MKGHEKFLEELGKELDVKLKEFYGRRMGWILPVFDFGKEEQTANYISNCKRLDAVASLRELADALEKLEDIPPAIGEA